MLTIPELEPAAIRAAHGRIDPVFIDSPQYVHEGLSARLGVPVIVKVETVNPIRAFKGRGTWLAVHALAEAGRIGPERPVVVASAGNFGQGVAYAARALGLPAVVYVSRNANRGKIERMRALGADGHRGRRGLRRRPRRRRCPRRAMGPRSCSSMARIRGPRPVPPRWRSR